MSKKTLIERTLFSFLGLIFVVLFAFFLPRLLPGDPLLTKVGGGVSFSEASYQYYRSFYGFDRPLWDQFWLFIQHLFDGTMGYSIVYGSNCATLIWPRFWITLSMTLPAIIISAALAMVTALFVTTRKKKIADGISTSLTVTINAFPTFVFGMIFLIVFCFKLRWFPSKGYSSSESLEFLDVLHHLFLPVLILVLVQFPGKYLLLRNAANEVMKEKFVFYAKTRSVSSLDLQYHYILPNACGPFLTSVGLSLGGAFSGSLVLENIFSISGIGQLMNGAITESDYPLISSILILVCFASFLSLLVVDVVLFLIDPKRKRGNHA